MRDREDLLDIKQAARFLNVSEASLRRWTNSGRLNCLRVGGRRERRFRRSDLLAFAGGPPAAGPALAVTQHAQDHETGGLPGSLGSHLCGLYASDLSRVSITVAFLADALRPGSVCYFVAAPEVRDQVLTHLERHRPSVPADVDAGRLVLSEYAASVPSQYDYWETSFSAAVRQGARTLRVVGDVSGGLGQRLAPREVVEYEVGLHPMLQRFRVETTLCLYDVRRSSGLDVLDVLKCHQDVFRYPIERLFS
jgi:transcriptional repressor of dcmA and dcmR